MIAIRFDKTSFIYTTDPIFEDLSFEIHDDRVSGLIGPNGCGKSTLLKLLQGELKTDDGFIFRQAGLSTGYLPQEPGLNPVNTLWQEVSSAHTSLATVEGNLLRLEHALNNPQIYNDPSKLTRTLDEQARELEKYTVFGGPGFEGQLSSILIRLGFNKKDFSLPISTLSGGQKKLAGLAKLLILKPKLLLLDEPDNHLDLDGKDFLIKFIQDYSGGVVIVSHDRYLLDLVVDEILDLDEGVLQVYPGNYSEYAFEKQVGLLRQQRVYQAQQKEINRLEQSANRLLAWGHIHYNNKFITRGRNILKRIERMDKIDQPVLERKRMGLELPGWRGSQKVLEISGLEKSFPIDQSGNHIVIAGLNTIIWRGDRVGLIGPNGSGKSLLFRMILGVEEPSGGTIQLGPSIKVGYYAQEHETLSYERSLIDTVRQAAPLSEGETVAFLGKFLFSYQQACGVVANLSGGERSRMQMALLMLSGANLLLLDEPTNNLDIQSAEVLEAALGDFEGTILVISHDRYFLDRVVNKISVIENGGITEFMGNFSEYEEQQTLLLK